MAAEKAQFNALYLPVDVLGVEVVNLVHADHQAKLPALRLSGYFANKFDNLK